MPNSFQSGIGVISGWVCEAEKVEIEIETERGETERQVAAVWHGAAGHGGCGARTGRRCVGTRTTALGCCSTGIGWARASIRWWRYVDDVELGRAVVRVTTVGEGAEEEFLRDVAGECVVADFPTLGETVTLAWQQNSQNFVITDAE